MPTVEPVARNASSVGLLGNSWEPQSHQDFGAFWCQYYVLRKLSILRNT